jgi:5-methylcytosine-specific restriction endonuclease McrA
MGKRLPGTPRSRIRAALRQLFLRSRERAAALKRDQYTCQYCHQKQSRAKFQKFDVQVHHREGIGNWEKVIDSVFEELLCSPEKMETICKACHSEITKKPMLPPDPFLD